MALNQYIGARYVPLIKGEWDSTISYEPLSIVLYQGSSYTSICSVPIGIPPTNTAFWALSGNYNAQVEEYRKAVIEYQQTVDEVQAQVNAFPKSNLGDYNTHFLGRVFHTTENRQSAQGLEVLTVNGTKYLYVTFTDYATDEKVSIVQYSLDGTLILESAAFTGVGHGSLGYYAPKNNLYLFNEGTGVITFIDPTTLTITETVNGPRATYFSAASDDTGNWYLITTSNVINKYSPTFELLVSNNTAIRNTSVRYYGILQESYVHDGNLYTCVQANRVCIFDCETLNFKFSHGVPFYASDYYPIGELQKICIERNGDFYGLGKPRMVNPSTDTDVNDGLTVFVSGNIYSDTIDRGRITTYSSDLFVSQFNVNSNTLVFRPDGTGSYPFNKLSELGIVLQNKKMMPRTCLLIGDFSTETLILNGANAGVLFSNDNVKINNIISNNSIFAINKIDIVGTTASITAIYSEITLRNVNWTVEASFIDCVVGYNNTALPMMNKLYTQTCSIIDQTDKVEKTWKNIGEYLGSNIGMNTSIPLSEDFTKYDEMLLSVQLGEAANYKTVGTAIIPTSQFVGGALYVGGNYSDNLDTLKDVNVAFSYATNTTMPVSANNTGKTQTDLRIRVWVK